MYELQTVCEGYAALKSYFFLSGPYIEIMFLWNSQQKNVVFATPPRLLNIFLKLFMLMCIVMKMCIKVKI